MPFDCSSSCSLLFYYFFLGLQNLVGTYFSVIMFNVFLNFDHLVFVSADVVFSWKVSWYSSISFLKSFQSVFLYSLMGLCFWCLLPRFIFSSWCTMSWSPVPSGGISFVLWTSDGWLRRNKSRMFVPLVGSFTTCSRLKSLIASIKVS